MNQSEFITKKMKRCAIFLTICAFLMVFLLPFVCQKIVLAMPFYDLQPKQLVLRASFYTSYYNSTPERKSNIKLCASAINKTLIDVNGEFSFNAVVGERTEKRGYKSAKIILNGEFVDGVGGGVCQVSSTLYNAVILAGLRVLESHAHSLPVSYVEPSFDAMVNSSFADLKFINNTKNPVYLTAEADDERIKINVFGEPMNYKVLRISKIIDKIMPLPEQIIIDDKNEYPLLKEGEKKVLRYAKEGYKSEGYIQKVINGKVISQKKLRTDKYSAVRGLVVYGKATNKAEDSQLDEQKLSVELEKAFQN